MQRANTSRVADLIRVVAKRQPWAVSVEWETGTRTYSELYQRSLRLANALLKTGLAPGDRVGILSHNCPEYFEFYIGLEIAGLVAVPINFRLAAPEVHYILANSGARALIIQEPFLALATAIGQDLPLLAEERVIVTGVAYETLLESSEPGALCLMPPNRPAVIYYTSGTTGFPKGAVMSSLNNLARLTALGWELGVTASDVMLVPGPMFHLSFSSMALIPLCLGGRTVVLRDFEPELVCDLVARSKVTRSFMVPKMFSLLLEHASGLGYPLTSVHSLLSSGSALPRQVFDELPNLFPNARISESMGWTESSWIVLCPHEDMLRKESSAGRAAFGCEVAILDEEGRELSPGEVGEIYAACPLPFLGYHENPEATAAMRRGKWETGGDIGYKDEEGFLFILDRKKDMIISGGENVYPAEIERVLAEHPGILEVAVVGVPDPRWGESPRACVVLRADARATPQDVIGFCEGRLARFKFPRSVIFLDALPRNAMGKVLRRELRDRFWQENDSDVR